MQNTQKSETEGLSIGQLMERQRAAQARIRQDSEVRAAARRRGASLAEAYDLARQARGVFSIVNGESCAVAADGRTVIMNEDGSARLTVAEWVARQVPEVPRASTLGPTVAPLPPVQRNPWRRASWNLTEQMRTWRRDPELARRLRDQAVEG
jgi:hypothetical protein